MASSNKEIIVVTDDTVANSFYNTMKNVRICSGLQIFISSTFWIWSLINNILGRSVSGVFDAGVLSFSLPLIAGIFGLLSTKHGSITLSKANKYLGFTIAGHAIVTIHYLVTGMAFSRNPREQRYFFFGAGLWGFSLVFCSFLALKWRGIVRHVQFNDE